MLHARLAVRAAAIVKVEHRPTDGTLFARQTARRVGREIAGAGLCLVRRTCEFVAAGLEEFELSALGTDVNFDLHRAREEIRQVAEHPAGLAELEFFTPDKLHPRAAAQAVELIRHPIPPVGRKRACIPLWRSRAPDKSRRSGRSRACTAPPCGIRAHLSAARARRSNRAAAYTGS